MRFKLSISPVEEKRATKFLAVAAILVKAPPNKIDPSGSSNTVFTIALATTPVLKSGSRSHVEVTRAMLFLVTPPTVVNVPTKIIFPSGWTTMPLTVPTTLRFGLNPESTKPV